jgi:hypothetical protein
VGRKDGPVIIVTRFQMGQPGKWGFVPNRAEVFPLTAASMLAVRPTVSLIKWIPGALAMGVRWQ